MKRLKILIWHIHGSYLNTLARLDHDWYLPVKPDRSVGYSGRGPTFDLPDYVREVPAEEVRNLDLDLVIFQTPKNYLEDQFEILSPEQQRLPKIYLEHNTPRPHPTDTKHLIDDPNVLLVHVTQFNQLMWDNNRTPTVVIEHSVAIDPTATYQGQLERGITVINGMQKRPRIVGLDIFQKVREQIPLDCAGMETEELGGLGDIPYRHLHKRVAEYRFFFNPIRYTSLGLAVCEAMTLGLPIIGLATTEMATAVQNGVSGYVDTDLGKLVPKMHELIRDPAEARRLGAGAQRYARERFHIRRFANEWTSLIQEVVGSYGGFAKSAPPNTSRTRELAAAE
jgi:glycosyltransferase involved in cell wall biosynthesis